LSRINYNGREMAEGEMMGIMTNLVEKGMIQIFRRFMFIGIIVIGVMLILWATSLTGVAQTAIIILGAIFVLSAGIGSWKREIAETSVVLAHSKDKDLILKKIKEENKLLHEQIEDEKGKRIRVLNVTPILTLGILEVECEFNRFFNKYFNKERKEIYTEEGAKYRFIGALKINFTGKYGIDMQNIRVKIDNQNKIVFVSGAGVKYDGMKDYGAKWVFAEGLSSNWLDNWVIDKISPGIAGEIKSNLKETLREQAEVDIRKGPEELNYMKKPIENHVKKILSFFILPEDINREYKMQLVDTLDKQGEPLYDFIQRIEFKELSEGKESIIAES
jgi:hypothetical protein